MTKDCKAEENTTLLNKFDYFEPCPSLISITAATLCIVPGSDLLIDNLHVSFLNFVII